MDACTPVSAADCTPTPRDLRDCVTPLPPNHSPLIREQRFKAASHSLRMARTHNGDRGVHLRVQSWTRYRLPSGRIPPTWLYDARQNVGCGDVEWKELSTQLKTTAGVRNTDHAHLANDVQECLLVISKLSRLHGRPLS